jgi:uncharacterized membrane protein YgdD (TMEM256/DUF423 family)
MVSSASDRARLVRLGALAMAFGVALGAFGAHGLRDRLTPDLLAVYETGVRYHLVHALGLFVAAWLAGGTRRAPHGSPASSWSSASCCSREACTCWR